MFTKQARQEQIESSYVQDLLTPEQIQGIETLAPGATIGVEEFPFSGKTVVIHQNDFSQIDINTLQTGLSKLGLSSTEDYDDRNNQYYYIIKPIKSDMSEINLNRWAKLAGINEALDAQSLVGKYVDLSQNVGMSGYNPRTAQDVIDIMPKFTNPSFGIKVYDEDPGKARWGHGIYLVQPDGTLKTISTNYDTSG